MKLQSAYKDIFLMSLSLGLYPFGRQHQGTAITGKQSKAFTFLLLRPREQDPEFFFA